MRNRDISLTVKTYDFVRLVSGAFLFFPPLSVRSRQANGGCEGEEIRSITIEALDDDSDSPAKAYTFKNTLFVDLNYAVFNELRESLWPRRQHEHPVKLEVSLDDCGGVEELRVNGRTISASHRRESDFRGISKRETGT